MPARPHLVKKGRTSKQQAATSAYGRTAAPIFAHAHATAPPTSSWWVGISREEFSARLQAERERMIRSTFGRIVRATTAKDSDAPAEM
jgi:hypothetical protein